MAFNWIIDALATAIDCSLSLSLSFLFLFFSRNNFVSPWLIRLYCLSACLKKERKKAHTQGKTIYLIVFWLTVLQWTPDSSRRLAGWLSFACSLSFLHSFFSFLFPLPLMLFLGLQQLCSSSGAICDLANCLKSLLCSFCSLNAY